MDFAVKSEALRTLLTSDLTQYPELDFNVESHKMVDQLLSEDVRTEIGKFEIMFGQHALLANPAALIYAMTLSTEAKEFLIHNLVAKAETKMERLSSLPFLLLLVSPNVDLKPCVSNLVINLFHELLENCDSNILFALMDLRPKIQEIYGPDFLKVLDQSLRNIHQRWPVLPVALNENFEPPTNIPDEVKEYNNHLRSRNQELECALMELESDKASLQMRVKRLEAALDREQTRIECGVCLGRGLEWVLPCGHHYCNECVHKIKKCAFCGSTNMDHKIRMFA